MKFLYGEKNIDVIFLRRRQALEQLKPPVSLKLHHQLVEKITKEQERFEKLLNIDQRKQDILSEYSFVLEPHFFEQKFLN